MERDEKHTLRKKLLTAKASNDKEVINQSFHYLMQFDSVEWDLVTLILSSIPNLHDSKEMFESFISKLQERNDLPENAYTCVISNYSFFNNPDKAMEWVGLMQKKGFPVKNRHLVSLIQLANETNNHALLDHLHSLLDSTTVSINQKVRTEEILLHAKKGDDQQVISTIRDMAKTDRYITDPSVIDAIQQFCSSNPSWKLEPSFIQSSICKKCKSPLKLFPLSMTDRSHLLDCLDDLTSTSYNKRKQFDVFKKEMEGIPIDVVVDGANVGFANANSKANRSNVYLNAGNIDVVVNELQGLNLRPFVILHYYHIKHLLKTNQSQIDILENLRQQKKLYYVREGSNDDWYWLYVALSHPDRFIVSNDQMRDHLFHAEKDDMLFRRFREESQITYSFPPMKKPKFFFPKPYSICIQESVNSFHLPFGHMEKSSFRLERWYCLRNCSTTIAKLMKQIK